jgi:nitrite reductase/ring-hydroxylating ferredoxin subunit/uncharacterized membrane protein
MANEMLTGVIDRQEWLDPLGDQVQKAVTGAFEAAGPTGQQIKNALHGTWLGHPLHPALTDVPIGAWTAAVVMDAMDNIRGDDTFAPAADAAIGIGLVGAVASAVTGLTDWTATDGRARKVGLTHGLMNMAGALLFTTSYVMRKNNNRQAARGFSMLGFAVAMGSAYLGGKLVFDEQLGVNHTAGGPPLPTEFVAVLPEAELQENQPRAVDARGTPVLLVRTEGRICAIHATCSHAGGPLPDGKIEGNTVRCPWHASRFCLDDGSVIDGPATHPQPSFETRVENGMIEVRARL